MSVQTKVVDFSKTFHRRVLKDPSVQFSSLEGRKIFCTALDEGNMDSYFSLAETYQTQGAPAFCGLGSLSMVLNALLIDPNRVWQGVWRWFEDGMLDCCEDIEVVKEKGIIMSKLACLARCQGAICETFFAEPDFDEEHFRKLVIKACTVAEPGQQKQFMIVSYSRKILNQTGSGHFSPIGGYCAATDQVLIMDVARFKHPPHWVPLPLLLEATRQLDSDSGKVRGVMMISASDELEESCREYYCACCEKEEIETTKETTESVGEQSPSENTNAYVYSQRSMKST